MNIVSAGSRYQVYGEDVKTYKELPLGCYNIEFNKMTGFYLSERQELDANEEKIYGNHEVKVAKVLNSFKVANRNFGIILSGQKGIGKSLFARILSHRALEAGYPVLVASFYCPGIADFISSIEQEIVVIFDEFEKTFGKLGDDNPDPQEELLSMFDGIDGGKKLFVVTCNEVRKLNEFLVNRPGRFHYHFEITNPSDKEVEEYLMDKLESQYYDVIPRVINLARTMNMTYDYLRAISFELNQGYSLDETLEDLNISRQSDIKFDVMLFLADGTKYMAYNTSLNLYSNEKSRIRMYKLSETAFGKDESEIIEYYPKDITYSEDGLMIPGDKLRIYFDPDDYYWDDDDPEDQKKKAEMEARIASMHPVKMLFKKNDVSYVSRYMV